MAIRRLSRKTNRAAEGLFAGLETLGTNLTRSATVNKANKEANDRQALNDYRDKVIAGTLDPDQAQQAAAATGINVPQGFFRTLQPSVESEFQKVIGSIGKADTQQAVPGEEMLRSQMPKRRSAQMPADIGVPLSIAEDRTPMSGPEFSPEFKNLLDLRKEKLGSFPAVKVEDTDDQGNRIDKFVPPDQLTGMTARPKPTFEQEGAGLGRKSVAQGLAEKMGGLPTIQGEAAGQQSVAQTKTELAGGVGTMKGQMDLQAWQANNNDAARVAAEIGNDVKKQTALMPGQVRLAGQTAAAGERARAGVQKDLGIGDYKPVKATAEQDKSYGYALNLADAHNDLLVIEPKLMARPSPLTLAMVNAPNIIQDPLTRQYAIAVGNYINAVARRDSGAAISNSEWERYGVRGAYQPGDDPASLAMKQANRRTQFDGIKVGSGPHGDVFVTLDEIRALAKAKGMTVEQKSREAIEAGYHLLY